MSRPPTVFCYSAWRSHLKSVTELFASSSSVHPLTFYTCSALHGVGNESSPDVCWFFHAAPLWTPSCSSLLPSYGSQSLCMWLWAEPQMLTVCLPAIGIQPSCVAARLAANLFTLVSFTAHFSAIVEYQKSVQGRAAIFVNTPVFVVGTIQQ